MQLFVLTYQRHQLARAATLANWPKHLRVDVVVQPQEAQPYRDLLKSLGLDATSNLRVLPPYVKGIGPTRDHVARYFATTETFALIDDDLQFLCRNRADHPVYLGAATPGEIELMFGAMEHALAGAGFAHVGVSMREGNNREVRAFRDVGRMLRCVAYRRSVLEDHDVRFRLRDKEDMDVTLQLLRLGYPNRIFYQWAQGQKSSNSPGGHSEERAAKPELMAESSHELARLHPGFVKVVQKTTKSSWGGGTRTDVQVSWKKAYESGLRIGAKR